MLGQPTAVGGDQATLTGVGDQSLGHRGDRVRDVVVPRATREGETSGHRKRPGIARQAQFGGGHLDRRREAGIEVDVVDVAEAHAAQFEHSPTRDPDCG